MYKAHRVSASGITITLLACLVVGCSQTGKAVPQIKARHNETKKIVCLFDRSESTIPFRQEYASSFTSVLEVLDYGDTILVSDIVDDSVQGSQLFYEGTIPIFKPKLSSGNPILGSNKLVAAALHKKADQEMRRQYAKFLKDNDLDVIRAAVSNAVAPQIGVQAAQDTDIFGALHLAGRAFSCGKSGQELLFIWSDMVLETTAYNFREERPLTNDRAAQIIEAERAGGRLPDLAGVKVVVIGPPGYLDDQDQFYAVRSFWIKYFTACGAQLTVHCYGRTMPDVLLQQIRQDSKKGGKHV